MPDVNPFVTALDAELGSEYDTALVATGSRIGELEVTPRANAARFVSITNGNDGVPDGTSAGLQSIRAFVVEQDELEDATSPTIYVVDRAVVMEHVVLLAAEIRWQFAVD